MTAGRGPRGEAVSHGREPAGRTVAQGSPEDAKRHAVRAEGGRAADKVREAVCPRTSCSRPFPMTRALPPICLVHPSLPSGLADHRVLWKTFRDLKPGRPPAACPHNAVPPTTVLTPSTATRGWAPPRRGLSHPAVLPPLTTVPAGTLWVLRAHCRGFVRICWMPLPWKASGKFGSL